MSGRSAIVIAVLGLAPTLRAEDSPSGPPAAIEEIVVSARRRDERLEDVPVSITALSADDLVNRDISSPQGLQMATPGLVYQNGVTYAMPFIRGIGSNVFSPAV